MVMNPSFNGTSITNGTRQLAFDVSNSGLSSSGLIHFPNPNILKQGYAGYNIGNILSTTIPYPRCHTTMRKSRHFVPNECKDEYYWHKRLKNNEAARKSRQKRRTIDSVLEEKVLILLHENQLLRQELYAMKVKYGEIAPVNDHQEAPSSSDSMMDCTKMNNKKNGVGSAGTSSVALTNKLISQALAKSDEKRIGLRQSLLETINMSLSKENDGKHKFLSHHHPHIPDTDTLLYGAKMSTIQQQNNNNQQQQQQQQQQQMSSASNGNHQAAKFQSELLSNLASGTYVLTSLSPGGDDMSCLPQQINGVRSSSQSNNDQPRPMVMSCHQRIPSQQGSSTSSSPYHHHQLQQDCSADEKAMEAATTLANLLKRSASTHSSSSGGSSNGGELPPHLHSPTAHHPQHMPMSTAHLSQTSPSAASLLHMAQPPPALHHHHQHNHHQHHDSGQQHYMPPTSPVHSPIHVVANSNHNHGSGTLGQQQGGIKHTNSKQSLPHKLRFKERKDVS